MAHVLVIDNHEGIRSSLSRLMRAAGHEVTCAADGPEGLAAVRRRAPDVIVLDLSMPGMDGAEVLSRLRSDPGGAGIPVLLLSGYAEAELRPLAERYSVFRVFTKLGMDCDGLLAAVAEASDNLHAGRVPPPPPGRT
jgi:CheY-like chemotaxis protein